MPPIAAHVLRFELQGLRIGLRGAADIAEIERLLGHREELVDFRSVRVADEAFDEGLELAIRNRAHETVDRLSPDEGVDGRHRLHA